MVIVVTLIPFFAQNNSLQGDVSSVNPVLPTVTMGAMRLDPVYTDDPNTSVEHTLSDGRKKTVKHASKGVRALDIKAEIAKQVMTSTRLHLGNQAVEITYQMRPAGTKGFVDGSIFTESNNPVVEEVNFWVNIYNKNSYKDGDTKKGLKSGAKPVTSTQYRWGLFTEYAAKNIEEQSRTRINNTWVDDNFNVGAITPVDNLAKTSLNAELGKWSDVGELTGTMGN